MEVTGVTAEARPARPAPMRVWCRVWRRVWSPRWWSRWSFQSSTGGGAGAGADAVAGVGAGACGAGRRGPDRARRCGTSAHVGRALRALAPACARPGHRLRLDVAAHVELARDALTEQVAALRGEVHAVVRPDPDGPCRRDRVGSVGVYVPSSPANSWYASTYTPRDARSTTMRATVVEQPSRRRRSGRPPSGVSRPSRRVAPASGSSRLLEDASISRPGARTRATRLALESPSPVGASDESLLRSRRGPYASLGVLKSLAPMMNTTTSGSSRAISSVACSGQSKKSGVLEAARHA